jgi:hypothetical protein
LGRIDTRECRQAAGAFDQHGIAQILRVGRPYFGREVEARVNAFGYFPARVQGLLPAAALSMRQSATTRLLFARAAPVPP